MSVLNAIPRVILAPLFVIWLGIGIAPRIALSFILVAVLIFFTVFTGIRQAGRKLVERVVTLGGSRPALVRHVYLPSVRAWVPGNLKVALPHFPDGRGRGAEGTVRAIPAIERRPRPAPA